MPMRKLSLLLSVGFVLLASGCVTVHSPKPVGAPPSIVTTALPAGTVGVAYTTSLGAINGTQPYTWSISGGSLPAGLALTGSTISGTPTTSGMANFTVQLRDASNRKATANLSITINPASLSITTSTLSSGMVNSAYSATLQSSGGTTPITWSLTAGTLPAGLVLAVNGNITGTPTTAGTSSFTVQAADSSVPALTATKVLSISIASTPLSVVTTTLPDGVVGQSYGGATLQSAGGTLPVTWTISVGALPAGLLLNASTGVITGSPSAAGTTTFTVMATDSTPPVAQTATKQLSIRVNSVLTVTTTSLPGARVNTPYSATLQSSGGAAPVTWSITAGSLPSGLTLNFGTGVISGTPTTVGTGNFTVTVTDSTSPTAQTAAQPLSITVSVAALTITTTSLPNGVVTSNYNQTLQSSGGTTPVTWAVTAGALPAGLTLNGATGNISGTPTTIGTDAFTITATDSTTPRAQTATASLSITINTAACGTGSESLLKGQYAFAMEGFDVLFPEGIGGIFDADGAGHIAQNVGLYDINDADTSFGAGGVALGIPIVSANSSYSIGSDGRGCLTIALNGGGTTFRFALGNITGNVASTGHILQFDASLNELKVGILRKQDPAAFSNAAINGNYAFGGTGAKSNSGKYAIAGTFNASSGTITAGQLDINDNGNVDNTGAGFAYPPTPIAFTGSYNIPATGASAGRGTLTISTGASTIHANVYVVSSSEMLILSTDAQATNPLFEGSALQTTQSSFANNSLNAPSIVYTTGLGNNGGTVVSRVSANIFAPDGSGGFTYNGYENSGGTISANTAPAGVSYSVASNGRVTIVGPAGGSAPIFYLVSPNKGFVLFTDNSLTNPKVEFGFLDPQSGAPFSNSSANGTYAFGSMWPSVVGVTDTTGVAKFTAPNINVTSDAAATGSRSPNATFTSTYSIDSTGLGVIPAGCSILGPPPTCQTIFYVISPTKAVVFSVQSTNPDLQIADK